MNSAREAEGLPALSLGTNSSSQLHADSMLENCFASHWGLDGSKPYTRYQQVGGDQVTSSVWSGDSYCVGPDDGYAKFDDISVELSRVMDAFIGGSHPEWSLLNPRYTKVNIGVAWDEYNLMVYKTYETDYVRLIGKPTLKDKYLEMSGRVRNGAMLIKKTDLSVMVYYDPPMEPLTRAQLMRTTCYNLGRPVAQLRQRPRRGYEYTDDRYSKAYTGCPNPYAVDEDAPLPQSLQEARTIRADAKAEFENAQASILIKAPAFVTWVNADDWNVAHGEFSISADLSDVISRRGVYSVWVWAKDLLVAQYSFVH